MNDVEAARARRSRGKNVDNPPPCLEYQLPIEDGWLHVVEAGPPIADVTVVFTHGWGMSSQLWEDVRALLVQADPGLRVIAYDHRGHGLSSPAATASIDVLADDLATVVNTLVPTGRIVYAGHSLGGMTLMALAQRHRELIVERGSAAAFVNTSAGDLIARLRKIRGVEWVMALLLMAAARFRRPTGPLVIMRQTTRSTFGVHPRRHDMNRVVQQGGQCDPRVFAALGKSLLAHNRYDSLEAFRELNVAVLTGTRDPLTPPPHAARIAECLPAARVAVYGGSGHFLPYERREAVADQLLQLVAEARKAGLDAVGAAG